MTIKHSYTSTKYDPTDSTRIGTTKWNADHLEGVEVYGAVGDGATDDTAALQAAIDAAATGSGIVFFPAGIYLVTNPIVVGSNVTLAGAGSGIAIIVADNGLNDSIVEVTSANDVTISGLTFDGNRAGQTAATTWAEGVLCVSVTTRLSLIDCEIRDAYDTGFYSSGVSSEMVIRGCRFHDIGGRAVFFNGDLDGLAFSGNHIYDWAATYTLGASTMPGMTIWAGTNGCTDFAVTDNVFRATRDTYFSIESAGAWGPPYTLSGAVFSGNVFDAGGFASGGISGYFFKTTFSGNVHKDGCGDFRSGYELIGADIVCSGNVIEEGSIALGTSADGAVANVTISNNTISASTLNTKGIWFGGSYGDTNDIVVSGNNIDMTGASGSCDGIFAGYYGSFGQVNRIDIRGNHCIGPTVGVGINLWAAAGTTDIVVSGNTCRGWDKGISTYSANLDEVTIFGNDVRGNDLPISHDGTVGTYRIFLNVKLDDEVMPDLADLYGAVGDGTTDDTAAIQAAIDACHAAGGGIVYGNGGDTYKISRAVVGNQFRGGIRPKAGVSLDFQGATLLLADNCDFITNDGLAEDGAQYAIVTGNVAIGDTNLTVDDSTAFTNGDLVGVRLTDHALDDALSASFYFARVTNKPDSTHLTLDQPARIAMVAASTEAVNRKVTLLDPAGVLDGTFIRNVRLINPMTGGANAEQGINLHFARNVLVENVYGENVGAGAVQFYYSENCVARNIRVDTCDKQGSVSKGRVVGCVNSRNIVFENVQGRDFEGCFCFVESYCDNIVLRDIACDLTNTGRAAPDNFVFIVQDFSTCQFDGVTVTGDGAGQILFAGEAGYGKWRVRNLDLLTSTQVLSLWLADRVEGRLRILHTDGVLYEFQLDQARWWQQKIPLTDNMSATPNMPPGLLLMFETYMPDEVDPGTDLDYLYIGRTGDNGEPVLSYAETGKLIRSALGAFGYGTGFGTVGNRITEEIQWLVDTPASGTPASYIILRALIARADDDDSYTWSTAEWERQ